MKKLALCMSVIISAMMHPMDHEKQPEKKDVLCTRSLYATPTTVLSMFLLPELIKHIKDYCLPEAYWKRHVLDRIIHSHQFHACGSQVVAHHDKSTDIYDIHSDKKIDSFPCEFSIHPQRQLHPGGTLWTVDDNMLSIYDRVSKQPQRLKSNQGQSIHSVKLSPHGTYAAIQDDEGIDIILAKTKKILKSIQCNTSMILQCAFSADESTYALAHNDSNIGLYNLQECINKPYQTLHGHTWFISSIAFSGNNQKVLTSSHDQTARLWGSKTGRTIQTYTHPNWVYNAQFGPDESWIISGCIDGKVRFFDTQSDSPLLCLSNPFPESVLDRYGNLIMSDDGTIVAARDGSYMRYFINPITYLQYLATTADSSLTQPETGNPKKRKRSNQPSRSPGKQDDV